ncbi:MAG: hypothetical protein GY821_07015, partial [Gammaproteobacteria bacterium]|nr:hypothetical protein [Gammaproteobacteria bacterium]
MSQCLACTAVTQLAKSADKSHLEQILGGTVSGLEEEEESDRGSLHSARQSVQSYQPSEVSDADGEETVVYKTQGDEIWALKSGILTKVGDTSEIKSAMDKTAVKEMIDALVASQEASRNAERNAEKAERAAEVLKQQSDRNSEMLRHREERIRDKQEMRDTMKAMLGEVIGQFMAIQANNNNNPQEVDNSQLNASVSHQLQEGVLETEPCHSGANGDQNGQNGDQNGHFSQTGTRKRGRSSDHHASQDVRRGQSSEAGQGHKGKVYGHTSRQTHVQSANLKQPQYSNSQYQSNPTERGGHQVTSTPNPSQRTNGQNNGNTNPNPNSSPVMQEQVSPLRRTVNFEDEYYEGEQRPSEGGRYSGQFNQNPPALRGYGEDPYGGGGAYDYEREEWYESDNNQQGQATYYQGQNNQQGPQNNYRQQNHQGQNHNRNEPQFKNR